MKFEVFGKIIRFSTALLVFLLPLFFLPLTPEFYFFNKLVLLLIVSSILLLLYLLCQQWQEKKISVTKDLSFTKIDLAVVIFLVIKLLSTFFNSHPAEAFYNDTGMILGLTLLYFLIRYSKIKKQLIKISLIISVSLLSLAMFYGFFGLMRVFSQASWIKQEGFTPAGSLLVLASLCLVVLPLILESKSKEKNPNPLVPALRILSFILVLVTVGITSYRLVKNPPLLLPMSASWQIAIEGFKNLKTLLLGVGPANFMLAFTQSKPFSLNQTPLWNVIFTQGRSEYLHLLTTSGFLGLLSFVFLVFNFFKKGRVFRGFNLSFLLVLMFFLVFPGNLMLWLVFYLSLALGEKRPLTFKEQVLGIKLKKSAENPSVLFLILPLLLEFLMPVTVFASRRAWLAERLTYKSAMAIRDNKAKDVLDLQTKAISLNPYLDRYHLNLANTSFLLANNLASKKNLSDQEKQLLSGLIQQSIDQMRIVTVLSPYKASSWQARGNLYRNLINLARGADQWTIVSFQQAISLDPANPVLRLDYGGLFYVYKNYELAIEQFKLAVQLKPDYSNGWYNLASAYREDNKYEKAAAALEKVLETLPQDSQDRQKVKDELDALKQKIPEKPKEEVKTAGELSLPENPVATPSGMKPVELPKPSPEASTKNLKKTASPSASVKTPFE